MSNDQFATSPFHLTIRSLFLWTAIAAVSFGVMLFANEWRLAAGGAVAARGIGGDLDSDTSEWR